MSTVVVVQKNGIACIAADTLTTFGDTRQSAMLDRVHDKIFQTCNSYLGIVGSAAHQMVLESACQQVEGLDFSGRHAIFESFRKLHPVLKEEYFLNPKEDEDDAYESTQIDALIINRSGIFGVFSLREVFEYTRFWAIGAGADFALGAMYALYDRLDSAEDIARSAISASAEFNTATALPLTCYSVALETPQPKVELI